MQIGFEVSLEAYQFEPKKLWKLRKDPKIFSIIIFFSLEEWRLKIGNFSLFFILLSFYTPYIAKNCTFGIWILKAQ